MDVVKWRDEYLVNVDEIDGQHKRWLAMINAFYAALKADRGKEATDKLLGGMLEYTEYHFSTEERLMSEHGYSGRGDHANQHRRFADKFVDINDRYQNGVLVISLEITNYLRDWLIKHILDADKKFGAFLNARGVH